MPFAVLLAERSTMDFGNTSSGARGGALRPQPTAAAALMNKASPRRRREANVITAVSSAGVAHSLARCRPRHGGAGPRARVRSAKRDAFAAQVVRQLGGECIARRRCRVHAGAVDLHCG